MALLNLIFVTLIGINMAVAKSTNLEKRSISYPYIATPERTSQILKNWKSIQPKMTFQEVVRILGEADEILPLFEPLKKNPKSIGKTWWYILQRDVENGTQAQKNEKVVRITFDLDDLVTSIDNWGL